MAQQILERVANRLSRDLLAIELRRRGVVTDGAVHLHGKMPAISNGGSIRLGGEVRLRSPLDRIRLKTLSGASMTIGDRTFLNDGVRIFAHDAVSIGRDCLIGDHCWIFDTNFHAVHEHGKAKSARIDIGNNVWLGRLVQVLPGVSIGDHSVVSAGSVVIGEVQPRSIMRGNPAVKVGDVRCSDEWVEAV